MEFVNIEKEAKAKVAVVKMAYAEDNRFHPDFLRDMMTALDELEADDGVRALVVTGSHPKFFCNGLDLEWLMARAGDPAALIEYLEAVNALYKRVTVYPKPMLAALNGHCFAGGLFLAAHMDFRFMREDRGWICLPEIDINIPLLPGMTAICKAVFSQQGFRQVYYTGGRFDAPKAVDLGFCDAMLPEKLLLPKAVEFAKMLGAKQTRTYAEMKAPEPGRGAARARSRGPEVLRVHPPLRHGPGLERNGLYGLDTRNIALKHALDPELEGHLRAGAARAGALEFHADGLPVFGDVDELDVSAIGLQVGTYALEGGADLFFDIRHRFPSPVSNEDARPKVDSAGPRYKPCVACSLSAGGLGCPGLVC